ncbi:biosynthetic arginine decarboxylase [Methylomonas sp. MS20]|uniref:biosynthetic arginine decarboxylase n=1 Tax=unclassified Methylomonas TaxID=2608980 RepID=UPI00143C41BC|nr:biosynthetic arginine decarboxylase [Methylomonas sp. MV1]MDT4331940.1 biosynthetic arginine decarboxylase [Methylomonas sp. MV1]NJA04504.1 biosynthetic arginine decarboxylase [Methylococcaceae bacterium WWC4]
MPTSAWSIEQAKQLYAIQQWGDGYFSINDRGHVSVKPSGASQVEIDLFEVAGALLDKGLSLPVLIRFTDILPDRIRRLQQAFDQARAHHDYAGRYTPVYPIKVNQQGNVVESIVSAEHIGLEAGSKPELLAILGLAKPNGTIVCNGYKDRFYIRMALMGQLMGLAVFIVIEKPSELELILEEAAKLQVQPLIGLRVRLSTISAGKWQNSGGEKSKFGLHANEVLQLVARLEQVGMLDCLRLMHFHMGSQIANIHDIKLALKEAGQFYRQLRDLGANITTVDAGGGLGVDYDGSGSRRECSINYSMREYADNIVRAFAETSRAYGLPQPDIITESGRAITAHHAVLITNVTEVETLHGAAPAVGRFGNVSEAYHNAQFDMAEARARFVQGDIGLAELADAEKRYVGLCQQIQAQLNLDNHHHREILQELDEKLADKVFCNFSLFQSMPDIWGIDQIFPIMPIHRLSEPPSRRAVLQDLTCDSDGRIDQYVDCQNIANTLPLHAIAAGDDYLIGFFMVGAYQEILGDMHNLFGDTHSINVELDGDGYRFGEFMEGEDVSELLDYVHIDTTALKAAYRRKLDQAPLSAEQKHAFEQELLVGLNAYTYLDK